MLPLEILLSSIDIGVDRVGSRLPLQGRCARLGWISIPPTLALTTRLYRGRVPTSRERAATAGIEPGTSSPGVARSTD